MQIIHCSPYRNAEGRPRTDLRREAAKALGPNWTSQLQTEDSIIDLFANHLDDDYFLLANLPLLENGPDADIVLFGPNGVWVMEFIHTDGEYKATLEQWLKYNSQANGFEPQDYNPVTAARDNAGAVYEFLHSKDLPVPWVNPVLILTHPNITVYNESSALATVKSDEIEQFARQDMVELDAVMDETDVQQVFTTLRPFAVSLPAAASEEEDGGKRKRLFGMTTGQWMVVMVLALLNLCVLGGFAAYLFMNQ